MDLDLSPASANVPWLLADLAALNDRLAGLAFDVKMINRRYARGCWEARVSRETETADGSWTQLPLW